MNFQTTSVAMITESSVAMIKMKNSTITYSGIFVILWSATSAVHSYCHTMWQSPEGLVKLEAGGSH